MSEDPTPAPAPRQASYQPPASDDVAKGRFIVLQMVRLSGFLFALAGLAIIAGKIALPQAVGYALLLMGVGDAMVIPLILTRRWKSPTK